MSNKKKPNANQQPTSTETSTTGAENKPDGASGNDGNQPSTTDGEGAGGVSESDQAAADQEAEDKRLANEEAEQAEAKRIRDESEKRKAEAAKEAEDKRAAQEKLDQEEHDNAVEAARIAKEAENAPTTGKTRKSANTPYNKQVDRANLLKQTHDELTPTEARDALPDNVEKLKDLLLTEMTVSQRVKAANDKLETEARANAPRVRDYDRMKNAFGNEAVASQSKWKPVKGFQDEDDDTQVLGIPFGNAGVTGSAMIKLVQDGKIVKVIHLERVCLSDDTYGSYLLK